MGADDDVGGSLNVWDVGGLVEWDDVAVDLAESGLVGLCKFGVDAFDDVAS